uniref:Reverse transcriptase domain-containing protein n=1 Tax=Labrus bergylta TaxID=56723 RepID=A0A3Q3MAR8_9LABR
MDAPSQFFFGLEKKSGQKKIFHSVRSNSGQSISDSAGIRKHAAGFYKDLYTSEFVDRPEVCESFYTGLPQVSAENNTELEAQLSLSELYSAVMSLQNGKAPGIDGLPVDFYKVFWSVLGEDLLEVLRDSLERGRLPLSCRRAVITLLPKKGDLQDLKNWRPVSLLCTDYKILSKVLASRLRQVMGSIIHTDQTYCVPGRLISDNITLIRHVLEVSGSLAVDTGLISLDQEKAFDRVEHQYLWRTLTAFGFNPCFLAKIQVLYRDIASVLKINGGLSAPFSVQRGVRQGCSLSGMLYSLAIEPLLHRLRSGLSGVRFPASEVSFKLSAYADDVIIFVNQQRDIDVLKETVILFGSISSAKVNWLKSEAVMVGEKLRGRLSLPGGLFWKSGGFKYLGVFLGNETFVSKNWEGVLEKVKGRLDKWRWLLPKMSFKGRVLVANNLVSSALWHRLTCIDPPSSLLCNIQRVLVDFFWDRLHWIPQSVLFLPKEEGGHGLVHLASRGATLRLQFLQRLLTGPADLVWRPLACCLLQRFGELGLSSSLFLMDLQQVNISSVTGFYQSVFNVWSLVNRQRQGHSHSLYWLLKEPVLFGGRFHLPDWAGPSLSGKFCSARISTLEQVVELTGPQLDCPAGLAARLGVRSTRVVDRLLKHWRHQLTGQEMSLMSDYGDGSLLPDQTDPFPEFTLSADLKDCSGPLLANAAGCSFSDAAGKTLYKLIVKTLNKKTLNARSDTPWRTYLGLAPEFRPSWESLYKPPLCKRHADLQWRILHGIIAVNSFISVLNVNVVDQCPFCVHRETVFHCFLQCSRLKPLFDLLEKVFSGFKEFFTKQVFICGFKYTRQHKHKCQLINFVLGQAKMAVYMSRRRKVEEPDDVVDVKLLFVQMLKSRVSLDFSFYRANQDLETFQSVWTHDSVLCSVEHDQLVHGHVLM